MQWHCLGLPDWPFHGHGSSMGTPWVPPPWPWPWAMPWTRLFYGGCMGASPQPPFPCPCHGIALGFLIGHSMGKALLWAFHGCPLMAMEWAIPWAWLFYRWLHCAPSPFIPNGKCHGIALGFRIGHSMGKALLWALHGCLPHGHGMGHSMGKALLWWLHGCLPQPPSHAHAMALLWDS